MSLVPPPHLAQPMDMAYIGRHHIHGIEHCKGLYAFLLLKDLHIRDEF